MRRISVVAVAIALGLVGCPLPQPLPTYPAKTITPPRILAATATSGVESFIRVPAGCATAPTIPLGATIFYQERVTVVARWFVDYRSDTASRYAPQGGGEVPPDPDPTVLETPVPTFNFQPYGYPAPAELPGTFAGPDAPGVVHVVELVVSNGFDPSTQAAQPYRTPASAPDGGSYEIQTYRWTFVNVPEDPTATCQAGAIGCPKCPP